MQWIKAILVLLSRGFSPARMLPVSNREVVPTIRGEWISVVVATEGDI
jgi:hypothetical protein